MKQGKLMSAVVGGILAGCMLLSAGVAFAADNNTDSKGTRMRQGKPMQPGVMEQQKNFKAPGMNTADQQEKTQQLLGQLVANETLTQDKANSILEFLEQKEADKQAQKYEINNMTKEERKEFMEERKASDEPRPEGPRGLMAALVEEGIITEDEADALQTQEQENKQAKQAAMLDEKLSGLVEDAIITEDQVDEITDYMAAKTEEQKAVKEKTKNMTEEERKEFFQENEGQQIEPLEGMVNQGIITQDQAYKLGKMFHKAGHGGKQSRGVKADRIR